MEGELVRSGAAGRRRRRLRARACLSPGPALETLTPVRGAGAKPEAPSGSAGRRGGGREGETDGCGPSPARGVWVLPDAPWLAGSTAGGVSVRFPRPRQPNGGFEALCWEPPYSLVCCRRLSLGLFCKSKGTVKAPKDRSVFVTAHLYLGECFVVYHLLSRLGAFHISLIPNAIASAR